MSLNASRFEDDAGHPRVTYRFHSVAKPEAAWQVVHARIDERVSTPYEAVVALASGPFANPESLLDASCTLEVRRSGRVRSVHGIVSHVETDTRESGVRVAVTVVPALSALGLGADCRVFADLTVPEVVEKVLGPALRAYGRELSKRLRRTYPVREYVVQYRESDLAFVSRLLAEEGIAYHFEHPLGHANDRDHVAERLCLIDDNDEAPDAKLGPEGARLRLERDHAGLAYHEAITEWVASSSLGCTGVQVRAYNWTHPSVLAEGAAPSDPGPRARYVPGEVHFAGYADGRYASSDASAQATRTWERARCAEAHVRCTGNVTGLVPGQQVEILDAHGKPKRWIVTRVHATGRDAVNAERALQHLEDYQCTLELIPAEVPLRPAPLGKPRAHGVQTGRVVGLDGKLEVEPGADDIHVDAHGRVRVKLSWDRTEPGSEDATVTCFLRVAQAWAGRGFGLHFTPRVGMEVVVSFIDGDPDRPLVTGCVYNGLNEPPFRLPEEKTRSGLTTQTTPGVEGYNAFVFEDAAGKECITLRAQRDHLEYVRQNQTIEVGGDRCVRVAASEAYAISGNRRTAVQGAETLVCTGGRSVRIAGGDRLRIVGEHSLEVSERAEALLDGGRRVRVGMSDELHVAEDKRQHVEGKYDLRADNELVLAQGRAWLQLQDSALNAWSAGAVQIANAAFSLQDDGHGHTTLTADQSFVIEVGKSRLVLGADGKIEIRGLDLRLHAEDSELTLVPAGATLGSPTTKIDGKVLTAITGKTVTLN